MDASAQQFNHTIIHFCARPFDKRIRHGAVRRDKAL
jgi:hypothetical protein